MASASSSDQPMVEVLLATYNGGRFLREQIDSILAQDYTNFSILASDDGSSDGTTTLLAEYAEREPRRFRILAGLPPTGSAQNNFLRLMQHATADYLCFSDQDDVWLPEKLAFSMQAMASLEKQHGKALPLLVFTDLRVVDHTLEIVHESMWNSTGIDPDSIHQLQRLVTRAVVTGCTMTIDRPMLDLARRMPPQALMHDRWIALLASSMGAAAPVRKPLVLYRQHERNVIGAVMRDHSPAGLLRRLLNNHKRMEQRRLNESQVEALLHYHGAEMPQANVRLLQKYLESSRSPSAIKRIVMTLRYGFFRQGLLANLALLLEPFRKN